MKKLYTCFAFVFFPTIFCVGQKSEGYENKSAANLPMASPNAASLGKYADFPVGYHTGTPEISIPIYTIETGPIEIPITADYHASGLKVMERASWIGAGWSLNAGGVITRSVRSMPDEKLATNAGDGRSHSYLKNHGYYGYIYSQNWDPGIGGIPTNTHIPYYTELAGGRMDGEPDLFFFNFNGYTGKFFFRPDGSTVVVPQQDIVIKALKCEGVAGCDESRDYLYAWTLTTPDGIVYYFGKTPEKVTDIDAIELNQTYGASTGASYIENISSWYLYKVRSADGKFEVNFSYETENYSYHTLSLFPYTNATTSPPSISSGMDLVRNIVYGVRLKQISFPNGTVEFRAAPGASGLREDLSDVNASGLQDMSQSNANGARALKQIEISSTDVQDDFCKVFEFDYDYFVDTHPLTGALAQQETTNTLHTDKKRLKLNLIRERSCDNDLSIPPYRFYYEESITPPRTLSLAQDHWGYFNGAHGNATLVPPISTDGGVTYTEGANRDASWPAMSAGSLKRIQYPTGGFTEFTFEAHENGNSYTTYTYTKGIQVLERNDGFSGTGGHKADATLPVQLHGKYILELRGINPSDAPNANGVFYLGALSFGISSHANSSDIIELDSYEPYSAYVSASQVAGTGYGFQAILYEAIPTSHINKPLVGGLRVAAITYGSSLAANTVTKQFSYKTERGEPSGVVFSKPNYVGIVRNSFFGPAAPFQYVTPKGCFIQSFKNPATVPVNSDEGNQLSYFVSPASIHPMRTSQGAHIGYRQVKVSLSDGGYTFYTFKTDSDPGENLYVNTIDRTICHSGINYYPIAPDNPDFSRGELISTRNFNREGVLLKEVRSNTDYSVTPEATGIIVKLFQTYLLPTEYDLTTSKKIKLTEEEFTYASDSVIFSIPFYRKTETLFASSYHSAPTKVTISDAPSGGKILSESRNTYVGDFDLAFLPSSLVSLPADNGYQTYLKDFHDAESAYNYSMTFDGCTSLCRTIAVKTFAERKNVVRYNYAKKKRTYDSTYARRLEEQISLMEVSELGVIYRMKRNNQLYRLVESSQWRDGKFQGSIFTTYKNFNDPTLNSLHPAASWKIYTDSLRPSSSFRPCFSAPGYASQYPLTFIKDASYVLEESYKYSNGNICEIEDKNSVYTSFLWGYNNAVPIVKGINVQWHILNQEFLATGQNVDLLRARTGLSDAFIYTFQYRPMVGMSFRADQNGIKVTYEYDKLGRLTVIRDRTNAIVKNYRYEFFKP